MRPRGVGAPGSAVAGRLPLLTSSRWIPGESVQAATRRALCGRFPREVVDAALQERVEAFHANARVTVSRRVFRGQGDPGGQKIAATKKREIDLKESYPPRVEGSGGSRSVEGGSVWKREPSESSRRSRDGVTARGSEDLEGRRQHREDERGQAPSQPRAPATPTPDSSNAPGLRPPNDAAAGARGEKLEQSLDRRLPTRNHRTRRSACCLGPSSPRAEPAPPR